MLHREPRKWRFFTKKLMGGIFVAEVIFFIGTFQIWRSMNNSRAFRFKAYNHCPRLLNGFYLLISAQVGAEDVKKSDYEAWGITEN